MRKIVLLIFALLLIFTAGCSSAPAEQSKSEKLMEKNEENNKLPEKFVLVEGGSFLMGSPQSEPWREKDEMQHKVNLSSFYMDAYEVTQKEYMALIGYRIKIGT